MNSVSHFKYKNLMALSIVSAMGGRLGGFIQRPEYIDLRFSFNRPSNKEIEARDKTEQQTIEKAKLKRARKLNKHS